MSSATPYQKGPAELWEQIRVLEELLPNTESPRREQLHIVIDEMKQELSGLLRNGRTTDLRGQRATEVEAEGKRDTAVAEPAKQQLIATLNAVVKPLLRHLPAIFFEVTRYTYDSAAPRPSRDAFKAAVDDLINRDFAAVKKLYGEVYKTILGHMQDKQGKPLRLWQSEHAKLWEVMRFIKKTVERKKAAATVPVEAPRPEGSSTSSAPATEAPPRPAVSSPLNDAIEAGKIHAALEILQKSFDASLAGKPDAVRIGQIKKNMAKMVAAVVAKRLEEVSQPLAQAISAALDPMQQRDRSNELPRLLPIERSTRGSGMMALLNHCCKAVCETLGHGKQLLDDEAAGRLANWKERFVLQMEAVFLVGSRAVGWYDVNDGPAVLVPRGQHHKGNTAMKVLQKSADGKTFVVAGWDDHLGYVSKEVRQTELLCVEKQTPQFFAFLQK